MITVRTAVLEDLEDILQLQEKYHVSNLTEAEKQAKGFVTMKVTPEQFTHLITEKGVFIALKDYQLAAYALTSPWAFYRQWAIIETMENLLPAFTFESKELTIDNSFQYGPVCIDENFRRQGILKLLFDAVKSFYASQFEYAITFINKINERSLKSHAQNTPLSIVGNFEFNGNQYHALACKV